MPTDKLADMRWRQEVKRTKQEMARIRRQIADYENRLEELQGFLDSRGLRKGGPQPGPRIILFSEAEVRELLSLPPVQRKLRIVSAAEQFGISKFTAYAWLRRHSTAWQLRNREPLALMQSAGYTR